MMNRVKTQTGPAPLIGGRAAFRGIINPLILAGGKFGQSPDIWASEYVNAEATPVAVQQQKITIVKPPAEVCPTSTLLKEYCDYNPSIRFCKKRNLAATDPQCDPYDQDIPHCPLTESVRKYCATANGGDPYARACWGQKINGLCFDQARRRDQDQAQANKDAADKKAKDDIDAKAKADAEINQAKINNWKATRGCRFHREDLTEADALTQTPCRTPAFNDARVGQYISSYGHRWKFLGWTPEQP
jgi:hypothetical protein